MMTQGTTATIDGGLEFSRAELGDEESKMAEESDVEESS